MHPNITKNIYRELCLVKSNGTLNEQERGIAETINF